MSLLSKLPGREQDPAEEQTEHAEPSVEEFVTMLRIYCQSVMAINLGITNLNMVPDMALFKRMLKIPTQNNKPGLAERARARKVIMQDYGLDEDFFKEIDASIKRICKTQMQMQTYFGQFQGFCNDLFLFLDTGGNWRLRFSLLIKRWLRKETGKIVRNILHKATWKEGDIQKIAWRIRKYAEVLHFSEKWVADFIYTILILARSESRRTAKQNKKD
ncbi:MAG: hypothetical protein LBU03_06715 [Tannerellaceae bacterium]|jgi:hypothetical protein|nr:hypothetical protein [Tannerellaceae bacterium]